MSSLAPPHTYNPRNHNPAYAGIRAPLLAIYSPRFYDIFYLMRCTYAGNRVQELR